MSFLGALGGIGAGISAGTKDLQDAETARQKQALTALQAQAAKQGIDAFQKVVDDNKAYGEIASGNQGEQAILPSAAQPPASAANMAARGLAGMNGSLPIMADANPASGATEGAAASTPAGTATVAGGTPVSMRKKFQKMANAALVRGDNDSYRKFTDFTEHARKVEDEGALDVAKMIHSGSVNTGKAEEAFNTNGDMRVKPGSATWDASSGTLSAVDASTGQALSMTKEEAKQYLIMSGLIKPDEFSSAGDGQVFNKRTGVVTGTTRDEFSSAGDGQVFNKLTGEVKGSPRSNHKPIVVNGAIFEQQDDGSGGITYVKVAEAPKQPSVIIRQGGDSLTTPQQRTNASIEAARTAIGGMSREELQKKTAKFTTTGRENPSYDPRLDGMWKQATSRKYGDDPHHDAFAQQSAQDNQPQQQPNHQQRFLADPAMKGMRLGKQTDRGVEVLDANGRLVGHYD